MMPTSNQVRVAMVRAQPAVTDMAKNWETFDRLARQAAKAKADICITPEAFLDGYAVAHAPWHRKQMLKAGLESAKVYLPKAKSLAKELKMMLVFGMTYTTPDGKCYNSAFLIGKDGRSIGRYDKTHLVNHDLRFDPGLKLPVFNTPFGKIGIMICADRRWPETARTLRVQGARIILNPTYGMNHLANEWWMRTRSYENQCFICFTHPEVSLVTDPRGNIHAKRRSKRPGVLVTDIDLSQTGMGMLNHRRPELYAPLLRPIPRERRNRNY